MVHETKLKHSKSIIRYSQDSIGFKLEHNYARDRSTKERLPQFLFWEQPRFRKILQIGEHAAYAFPSERIATK